MFCIAKKMIKITLVIPNNLLLRFEQHIKGEVYPVKFTEYLTGVKSTRHRRPLELIYFEACLNQEDAIKREKYSPREIKSKILMHSIISRGKKLITEECL